MTLRDAAFTVDAATREVIVVKVLLVPSSVARPTDDFQFLTSFVINDVLAVDAGSIGFWGSAENQTRIKHVLISHSHIDHVASLPIFVENVFEGGPECVTVYGCAATLASLRQDLFNDRIWPDFLRLSQSDAPFLKLVELQPGISIEIEGIRVTPVPVNHVVPTLGFILQDADSSVVIASDTATTDELWEQAAKLPNLRAVFLEATFPESFSWLADLSKHLTPRAFAGEMQKLPAAVQFLVVHLKPRYRQQVLAELQALGKQNLEVAQCGKEYHF